MAHTPRQFGKPMPLKPLMERGEDFFNAINEIDTDTVLTRAKRINKIAKTATRITGETLEIGGDSQAEGLIYSAYRNIYDITTRIVPEVGPDNAEELLTSDQTHQTLLLVSRSLKAWQLDRLTKGYRKQGTGFEITDSGLILHEDYALPITKGEIKKIGCPYAYGNTQKAALFTESTDNIVRTYTEAYRRGMSKNLPTQILRR